MSAILALPAAAFFVASSAGSCAKTFSNGDALFGPFSPGHALPELRLENGRAGHAIVKLVHDTTGSTHLFYVAQGANYTVRHITPGNYKINFAVNGKLASDCLTTTMATSVIEFTEPFELTRIETPAMDGEEFEINITINDAWVTLYEREGGEAGIRDISLSEFNR